MQDRRDQSPSPVPDSLKEASLAIPATVKASAEFVKAIDQQYRKLREGNYLSRSTEEVKKMQDGLREAWEWSAATPRDEEIESKVSRPKEANSTPDWMYRGSIESRFDQSGKNLRLSLNVAVSRAACEELDTILLACDVPFQYKFGNPASPHSLSRHDTIAIQIKGELQDKDLHALARFGEKYGRKGPEAEWDDHLLGENITIEGRTLSGFRIDRKGSVKTPHMDQLIPLLTAASPDLAAGVEMYLHAHGQKTPTEGEISSGMLAAIQRSLAQHGIVLEYDPSLIGFSVRNRASSGTPSPTTHYQHQRFQTFSELSDAHYSIYTADTLRALYLNMLPEKPREVAPLIDALKRHIHNGTVQNEFSDMKLLLEQLDLLKRENALSPSRLLLLEFWNLYREDIEITFKDAQTVLQKRSLGQKLRASDKETLHYTPESFFAIAIELTNCSIVETRMRGRQIVNRESLDSVHDLFTGLALAYQEKVHGLKLPQENLVGDNFSPRENDLIRELTLRARCLANREFLPSMTENLSFFAPGSELHPNLKVESHGWGPEIQVLFLQKMREAFGPEAHSVNKNGEEYLRIVKYVEEHNVLGGGL